MENETKVQARGCVQLGDLLIFGFGSFMMFAKTADVLEKFAPSDWFGLSASDYGLAAALLIEGFLVWRKFKMWVLPPKNFVEWAMDFITTFVPFGLSLAAQAIDGYITTGLINSMPEQQKTTITTIVALLIGVPLFLDLGKTTIENAPPGLFDNLKWGRGGVDSFINNLFNKKRPVQSQTLASETEQVKPSRNGKQESPNFTKGEMR